MTYSIVARDPHTGELGIAVASRFFAVGALVPHIRPGVGAVATQSIANPLYGVDGLALLFSGQPAEETVRILTVIDEGREQRQVHVIDAAGRAAAFTGSECIGWAGHRVAESVSVAGNMLAGPEVVDEALATFLARTELPLAERLLVAMQAGENAGGDKRGRQSAALLIHKDQEYPWLDIRADDHHDPLTELRRLYAVAQEVYLHIVDAMPTRQNPLGLADGRSADEKIAEHEAHRKASGRPSASHSLSFGDLSA